METNPGCHATVNSLSEFVLENLPNTTIEYVPLGTENSMFSENLYQETNVLLRNRVFSRVSSKLRILKREKRINIKLWERLAMTNISKPTQDRIQDSNLILINMEGTIHHNSIAGLALLAIALYSKKKGKIVALVNGSYQNMDVRVTRKIMSCADFISVRDSFSYNYLASQGVELSLIPDFAFRAKINSQPFVKDQILSNKNNQSLKKCLYTVGVLGAYPNQENGVSLSDIKRHIFEIDNLGYKPYYLKIEEKETQIANELAKIGVPIISYEDGLNYNNIGSLISKFDLLITGRYHIGIFGLMNYIKTFFLKSNTYKTEGLLNMLGLENRMIEGGNLNKIKLNNLGMVYQLPNDDFFRDFKQFLKNLNHKI
ncbi:polysaccharide pyruvyl transferase family protein [Tamlana crocina]